MNAKKRAAIIRDGTDERPPTSGLLVMAWFPVPGLAAMNLAMIASGLHDPLGDQLSPELRHIAWAHLAFQLLIGCGVTAAIVRRLNLEGPLNHLETTHSIRRDHVTGWCLQVLAAVCFGAYLMLNQ